MVSDRSRAPRLAALLLGSLVTASAAHAQAPAAPAAKPAAPAHKSVYGKLEMVDQQLNGIVMTTDEGKRVAWKFDKAVIARLLPFKPGSPVIVIYSQRDGNKAVTAIAFPGTADRPLYVNASGERVEIVGGPIVDGQCGQPSDKPLSAVSLPIDGQADLADACWCCAPAGETCIPGNKTGAGQAFIAHCYK